MDFTVLSPCLSTSTFVPGKTFPAARVEEGTALTEIRIMLPNLMETKTIQIEDLEEFAAPYVAPGEDLTTLHLLIYIFAQNWTNNMAHISDIKLIHMGKQYKATRLMDLHSEHPTLQSVAGRSPNFQLFVTPNQVHPPVVLSVDELMERSKAPKVPEEEVPVTYADAMIRLIRRASHRKGSVLSATDSHSELSDYSRKRNKFKHSWRKVINCMAIPAR